MSSKEILSSVLFHYGINYDEAVITSFGKGLINHTWKVQVDDSDYILQRINETVFKNPYDI
ncbi:MAG TPA: hypothetical protein VM935_20620, partial [Chitinophagaceae bacterium]|nr:hypothetical protein [Chitinophagaceae bacterium]